MGGPEVCDVGGGAKGGAPPGVFTFKPQPFPSLAAVLDETADALTRQLGLEHCAVFAVDGVGLGARLCAMHGRPPLAAGQAPPLARLAATLVDALAERGRPAAPSE